MKKITLFLFLTFFCFNSHAQFPEGFEGFFPPPGWVTYGDPWEGTTIANTGNDAAYSEYGTTGVLVTPQFTPNATEGTMLSFYQRQSYGFEYYSTYKIYVSTTAQEPLSEFELIDTQTESDFNNIYSIREVDLSAYEGIPIYVAFVHDNDDGDDWFIDDVSLTIPPSAAPVCATNFEDTASTECGNEDFAISWDAVADANGYLLTLGTTPGGIDIADALDIGALTSITIPNVVADQSYYYTVTPYNSAGNAEGCVEQSVTTVPTICTPCDRATALTPGTQQSGDTSTFGDTFDDSQCLGYYDGGDDAVYSYVATEDGETMTVTVDFTSTWGGVAMSLGCPSGDSTAYTCVGSVTGSGSGVKSFTSDALIAGETYYIHISTNPSPQSTAYTLDTEVIAAPACLTPLALEASSVTTDSAVISWTSEDSSFNIEVVDVTGGGAATGIATYSGVTSPYTLTGLSSNNQYEVYVQTDCSRAVSDWGSTTFLTQAGCGDSISYAYESSFDGLAYSFSAPSGQYASVSVGGQIESGYDYMYITDGSGNDLYGSSTSLITGPLSGTYESTDGTILIYVNSDSSLTYTMTFAFSCYDPPTSGPDCAANFVNSGDPSCGNEDFTVSWDAVNGAIGYLITAGTTSGGNDLADAVDQSGTSYAFTAVPGQSYYYTVTPYNSTANAEDCVEQSVTLSTTICTPCDSAIALTPGTQQSGDTSTFDDTFDDSQCLGSYDGGDDAVYSYVATEDGETMSVTVDFTTTYGGVAMSLGCPSGDSTAYTCVGSVTGPGSGVKSFTSDALVAGETYYIHISTYAAPQSTAYTLDTEVIAAPSCLEPTSLTATGISPIGAVINWASDGSAFMIEIQLGGVAQGTPNSGTDTEPSVYVIGDVDPYPATTLDLTGYLSPTTSYSIYVANVCQDGNSTYSGPLDFTTTAFPIVPDYTNDFSSFPGDLWSEAEGTIANGPSGSSAGWNGNSFSAPTYARINLWNADTDDWLISPEFDLSVARNPAYYLNLDVSVTAYSGGGEISMGSDDVVSLVMTTDGATWTILKQWSAADNLGNVFVAMDEIEVGVPSSARFAIHASEGTVDDAEDYYFNIDNFSITSSSLGINNSEISQFTYFPNPVNDQLTINAQTSVNDIAVLNMLGQVVLRQSPNSLNCVVDMAELKTGVYFVQVSIGNKTETVRVLKQ